MGIEMFTNITFSHVGILHVCVLQNSMDTFRPVLEEAETNFAAQPEPSRLKSQLRGQMIAHEVMTDTGASGDLCRSLWRACGAPQCMSVCIHSVSVVMGAVNTRAF